MTDHDHLPADQIAVECDLHCAWKGGGPCLRDDCPRRNSDKGLLNGRCNRTACTNRPATWYSTVEQAHYCQPCARLVKHQHNSAEKIVT